tara:strand:- start:928 stop:1059 length:132 start_codon:yes stop_codon:yes gene_type:complete
MEEPTRMDISLKAASKEQLIKEVQEQQEQINKLKLKMCTCHGK